MEAQRSPPRYANVVSWHDTGEQGAGRQAWPVNDNPLPGFADFIEFLNVGGDLPSWIADDSHVGGCRARH
jgi:hypothetical protein